MSQGVAPATVASRARVRYSPAIELRGVRTIMVASVGIPLAPGGAPNTPPSSSGTVKSLSKGLKAVELLIRLPDLGTLDLAKALKIDKGAASRIMKTLVQGGFAVQDVGRRFRAGPLLQARAAAAGGASIRERARPLLVRIFEATGETAQLAIRADDQLLYLDKIDTQHPLRVDLPVGTLAPVHCTALGKVLLAFGGLPAPRTLPGFTRRTPVSAEALATALAAIVACGYATEDEEFAPGIRCVAAPVRDPDGAVIAAVGLAAPTTRLDRNRLPELGQFVATVAREFVRPS